MACLDILLKYLPRDRMVMISNPTTSNYLGNELVFAEGLHTWTTFTQVDNSTLIYFKLIYLYYFVFVNL